MKIEYKSLMHISVVLRSGIRLPSIVANKVDDNGESVTFWVDDHVVARYDHPQAWQLRRLWSKKKDQKTDAGQKDSQEPWIPLNPEAAKYLGSKFTEWLALEAQKGSETDD